MLDMCACSASQVFKAHLIHLCLLHLVVFGKSLQEIVLHTTSSWKNLKIHHRLDHFLPLIALHFWPVDMQNSSKCVILCCFQTLVFPCCSILTHDSASRDFYLPSQLLKTTKNPLLMSPYTPLWPSFNHLKLKKGFQVSVVASKMAWGPFRSDNNF